MIMIKITVYYKSSCLHDFNQISIRSNVIRVNPLNP